MRNWAGNYSYRAETLHEPSTLDELREIVATAPRVRVLGSRHSFNGIGDSDALVSLAGLPADVVVDHAASTATFSAGLTYGELAAALEPEGVALANLASLPHISVAGAIATATHGSGDANGNLATAVVELELVTSEGEIVTATRGQPDFDGLVVGLGALGAVTRVTLDVEPAYEIRTRVFEALRWSALLEHFDEITAAGYSVSVFTRWGEDVDQVWIKDRGQPRDELFGARPATVERHPILGVDATNTTPQLGRPGLWSDQLPHFRMGFTPSAGDELQSEYFVAREHAVGAIEALRGLRDRLRPLIQVSEIRTIAADRLWLSPQYGQDTVAFHFTWRLEPEPVMDVLQDVEAALRPFAARPHWGKLFNAPPDYERRGDFIRLTERLDPRGAFRNRWLDTKVLERE
jgi:xylitol oxidase